ncbi:TPA: virulence factor [Escherichia coli]|uniref:CRISPR associated Cas2 family protein n=1 Tax=Escherichia coli TaxID=562 RepID=UPI0002C8DF1D|nr:CRISPR associated Cas2 family protein [Escherichia coli]EAA4627458.1 virulence factor [Escherichia coli]EAA4632341.1 virulence factor [Escherichia coli]EEW0004106.1 virulence factor [Escherichia coli]EFG8710311.1 virulence factor [Escherichia coli]EFM3790617.1 virulence factor [Escherichia coli]
MYAISFDLSVAALDQHYPGNNYNNAYAEIRRFLEAKGFNRQQGSVYFGDNSVDAVRTVMAVNALSNQFPWLKACVSDIRMLRIEENNDLSPAL